MFCHLRAFISARDKETRALLRCSGPDPKSSAIYRRLDTSLSRFRLLIGLPYYKYGDPADPQIHVPTDISHCILWSVIMLR